MSFAHSPVALDGQPVPGGGILVCEGWFDPASANGAGQIAFGAALLGGSSTSAQLISQIGNLPDDANDDGLVNATDWAELPASLGRPDACIAKFRSRVFDFEGDNDIDLRDMARFQAAFGG